MLTVEGGRGGLGAESYDSMKTWVSINPSILSGTTPRIPFPLHVSTGFIVCDAEFNQLNSIKSGNSIKAILFN
jgi:hypothetical protein